jgi:ATP-dependent helicase HrpB
MEPTDIHATIDQLPITPVLGRLKDLLRHHPAAVLVAPPGAGKTTTVPLALLDEPWLSHRRMLMLAPRRLAARTAAHRLAALLGQRVGQTVGYRMRLETRVGPHTRIEVITEGILTRMLQSDSSLDGVGLVIFDEFHERSLDADLGLALCRDIQGVLNEHLRLLVMSATLDPAPVSDLLGDAPLIQCDGRVFPVETRHVDRPVHRPVERAVAEVICRSVAASEGNLLAFLPGAPEIRRVVKILEAAKLPDEWLLAPLYGTLPRDRQDAALIPPPSGRHKIVLATSIAETSLTIEGIGVVVDSGLQRTSRFDPVSGMSRLVTQPVSQASADQRRGRAGRLGPGICYRLWSEAAHPTLPAYQRPEILDADLAGLALELAAWGVDDPSALGWLDPPPAAAFSQARDLLVDLKALDPNGKITGLGRRMAALPLHPRLAHMILTAQQNGLGYLACEIAALLGERDPLHFVGHERDADLRLRLEALEANRTKQPFTLPAVHVDQSALRQIRMVATGLQRRLGFRQVTNGPSEAGRVLAWAYPDRIAQQRPGSQTRYLLTNGRGAFFESPEPLSANEYLVAAHLDGQRHEARIFMAAAIDRQDLLSRSDHRIHWQESITWDATRQAVSAVRKRVLGALTLENEPLRHPNPEAVMEALMAGIRKQGIAILPWTRSLRSWQARVALLAGIDAAGGPWPDVADSMLTQTLEKWLAPYLCGCTRVRDLEAQDLTRALHHLLGWRQQQRLEDLAPTHITVPSGSRLPIDYTAPIPVLAVRIQEMFGLATTPTIAGGRLPLMLHLLSPAGRPAQITQDLASFWQNSYPQVKKELRGRYPKHTWPDDPLHALPTSRANRRKTGN